MTVGDLRQIIRSVKPRVNVPVTYADVWEFWLRYREVGEDVDFVTAHFLPYWEDVPPRAEDAAAHVDGFRKQVVAAFPGKEILIGETGWPSHGRMRDGALASRVNQARFISQILERARQENFRVNFFEAYDEPWKRRWEGTVGGYWGLFDGTERKLKYPAGVAISNYPFWKLQMGGGLLLCICVFAVAWFAPKHRPSSPRLASWVAVAMSATSGGILLGVSADKMLHESYGLGGWLVQGFLLAAAVTAPLLSTYALMSGRGASGVSSSVGAIEGPDPIFHGQHAGHHADRDDAHCRANRAQPDIRRPLARFPVRRPDHGGGAVLDIGISQRFEIRRAAALGSRVRRAVRAWRQSMSSSTKGSRTGRRCGPARCMCCSAVRCGGRALLPLQKRRRWMAGEAHAPRTISRTMPTVSSIIAALTSRWVQARMRPSIIASRTPRLRKASTILSPATPGAVGLEEHQIGLGLLHLDAVDLRQAARQRPRIGVIVGEAVDVMVERVDAGRGADAGLPHRSAEPLLPAPDVVDESARAGNHAADRRAEAL